MIFYDFLMIFFSITYSKLLSKTTWVAAVPLPIKRHKGAYSCYEYFVIYVIYEYIRKEGAGNFGARQCNARGGGDVRRIVRYQITAAAENEHYVNE